MPSANCAAGCRSAPLGSVTKESSTATHRSVEPFASLPRFGEERRESERPRQHSGRGGDSRARTRPAASWVRPGRPAEAITLVFFALRLSSDVPELLSGTVPDDPFDRRYVEHPALAYLHIVPGIVFVLGAPVQLALRIRGRHYALHRRLARFLVGAGETSGVVGKSTPLVWKPVMPYPEGTRPEGV